MKLLFCLVERENWSLPWSGKELTGQRERWFPPPRFILFGLSSILLSTLLTKQVIKKRKFL